MLLTLSFSVPTTDESKCVLNSATAAADHNHPAHLMSYIHTEQPRYESLLEPYTDAVEHFRRQYKRYRSVPGVQRTITDGELMAACAFRTYEQCVSHILSKKWEMWRAQELSTGQLPRGTGSVSKATQRTNQDLTNLLQCTWENARRERSHLPTYVHLAESAVTGFDFWNHISKSYGPATDYQQFDTESLAGRRVQNKSLDCALSP